MGEEPVLAASGLVKRYGKVEALAGLDLEVTAGSSFSLLGPNGAGKTTLMKAVLGLVMPDAGRVELMGRPAASPLSRRGVRYLPESITFPGWATPGVLHRQLERVRGESTEADLEAACARLGCDRLIERPVGRMSRGQRQRVALALVICGSPELVLLDEPASGLDPGGRILVRNAIRELVASGTTVMLNSHMLGEVELVCDRAAFISEGRLVASGELDELARQKGLALVRTVEPAGMSAELEEAGYRSSVTERGLEVLMEDPGSFPSLTRAVLETGLPFTGVELLREDLEEVFLRLMGDDGDGGGDVA